MNGLSLRIEAVVDKNFANSIIASDVQPSNLANNPQTHFAKLRLNKNYNYTHNGHYVSGAVNQTFTIQQLQIMLYGPSLDQNMMYVVNGDETISFDSDWQVYEYGDLQRVPASLGQINSNSSSPLGKAVRLKNQYLIVQTAQVHD